MLPPQKAGPAIRDLEQTRPTGTGAKPGLGGGRSSSPGQPPPARAHRPGTGGGTHPAPGRPPRPAPRTPDRPRAATRACPPASASAELRMLRTRMRPTGRPAPFVKRSSRGRFGATPFMSCSQGERDRDEEQDQDGQPFCRSIAAVRIDPEYGLYPVMPEERNDGGDPGDRAAYGFQPESKTKT